MDARIAKAGAMMLAMYLGGCQSAPPMSEATFAAAKKKCALQETTYLYRKGLLKDEPLIDFSREASPAQAHICFNAALQQVDREATERGATRISYIWEWKT
jgi:hypothetical protein